MATGDTGDTGGNTYDRAFEVLRLPAPSTPSVPSSAPCTRSRRAAPAVPSTRVCRRRGTGSDPA
jgi:hypothetical protein